MNLDTSQSISRPLPSGGAASTTQAPPASFGQSDTTSNGSSDTAPRNPLPSINLPKGGGAIRDIGEKFEVNAATGTGSTTIPVHISSSRSGFVPSLGLSYDSGAGNGPFGFGWRLKCPSITRKTDKGLPLYQDEEESDIFILAGAEDLVPVLDLRDGKWLRKEDIIVDKDGRDYQIRQYRPRVEASFMLIERWTDLRSRTTHWVTISGDNVTDVFGDTQNSQIRDPDSSSDEPRIFCWLLSRSYDDKGNAYILEYKAENNEEIDVDVASEINRTSITRSAQRYLKRLKYGNRVSHLERPDWESGGWMFEVVLDYGEHSMTKPSSLEEKPWNVRPDPFSTYRSTFEARTYRLCERIMMFHHFPDELNIGNDCIVSSLELSYRNSERPNWDRGNKIASFVSKMTQRSYQRQGDGYLDKALPPLDLEYSLPVITEDVRELHSSALNDLPAGIDGSLHQWLDLDGEGIPGVLIEEAGSFFYKPNLGEGRLCPVNVLSSEPNIINQPNSKAHWLSLAADGHLDLTQTTGNNPGYFERHPMARDGWDFFKPFVYFPTELPVAANPQFIDLNGDGLADILITNDEVFTWYPSCGKIGWGPANYFRTPLDEEKGPRLIVSDLQEAIYVADMSGDGLADLVRIRNGEVCYWPNIGYGRFGKKVAMDNSPWFDYPDIFRQSRLRLFDIDGCGTTDLIYLGDDGAHYFQNEAGNSWTCAHHIKSFPKLDDLSQVQVVDLLGRGTGCLVWSSYLPSDAGRQIRYVDLMGQGKPHLLVRTDTNMGGETRIHYTSSVKFYLEDKAQGRPWATRLAFPVQVIERVEARDHISNSLFVQKFTYHDGYFDGVEREFNGFGMVEHVDTESFTLLESNSLLPNASNVSETAYTPPVLTKTWYHTGAYYERGRVSRYNESQYYREPGLSDKEWQAMILQDTLLPRAVRKDMKQIPFELSLEERREACRALKSRQLRQEVYSLDNTPLAPIPVTVSDSNFKLWMLQPQGVNRYAAFFSKDFETLQCHYERNPTDPRITQNFNIEVDDFGNILQNATIAYGRRSTTADEPLRPEDRAVQEKVQITYTCNQFTAPISALRVHRNPIPAASQTFQLYPKHGRNLPGFCNSLFRSDDVQHIFAATTDGQHDLPYQDFEGFGAHLGHDWRRLVDGKRSLYRADDLGRVLPLGTMEARAVPYETYTMAMPEDLVELFFVGAERFKDKSQLDSALKGLGYIRFHGEHDWWKPSGKSFFSPASTDTPSKEFTFAQLHFFQARRYRDQYYDNQNKSEWVVSYDKYDLLPEETRDPLGNRITVGQRNRNPELPLVAAGQDYRLLVPSMITDPNMNLSVIVHDVLGHVVGSAIMGKYGAREGDNLDGFEANLPESTIESYFEDPVNASVTLLGHASTRYIYDIYAFMRERKKGQDVPTALASITRSIHDADLAPGESPGIMFNIGYFDGLSRTAQTKIYAGAGELGQGDPQGSGETVLHRYICSGWTVYNNKSKPILKYEPFFTASSAYEDNARFGVATTIFYDSLNRVIGTLFPNQTWSKNVYKPWNEQTWDANDTILLNPLGDPNVGDYFKRFFPLEKPFVSWYQSRIGGSLGKEEQGAAKKTEPHADTPNDTYYDSMGRKFLVIERNATLDYYGKVSREQVRNFSVLDIQGHVRSVIDALDRVVCVTDNTMMGIKIHQATMEAGETCTLQDVTGGNGYGWDSRHQAFRTTYDVLHRPLANYLAVRGQAEIMTEKLVYGEGVPEPEKLNLRMQITAAYDQAGKVTSDSFDFKTNLLHSTRWHAKQYKANLDWQQPVDLDGRHYIIESTYDAANRKVVVTYPDRSTSHSFYDEVSRLKSMKATLKGSTEVRDVVKAIRYNARSEQIRLERGNHSWTVSEYDPLTFRLTKLRTFRTHSSPGGDKGGKRETVETVQHLLYTYDPIGNVMHIEDRAQERIFFRNKVVDPSSDYTFDALYRLVSAKGREHISQSKSFIRTYSELRGDGDAMARYLERYVYDRQGNVLEIAHDSADKRVLPCRKRFFYEEQSQLELGAKSNRLSALVMGNETERFEYAGDQGITGNITSMSGLPIMRWDYKNELAASARQAVEKGSVPETTYYRYNGQGKRIRKITERYAKNGETPIVFKERVYVGVFEEFRKFSADGSVTLEEETLRLGASDDDFVLAETRREKKQDREETNQGELAGSEVRQLLRFQIKNHIHSVSIELGDEAQLLSYEEYGAYGDTTYEALRHELEEPKRYRFSDKELDTENGLYYFGARYYSTTACRWVSCDPGGFKDGENLYQFAKGNPVSKRDKDGKQTVEADETSKVKDPGSWPRETGVDRVEDFASWFTSPSFPDSFSAKYLRDEAGDPSDTGAQRLVKVLKETSTMIPGLQTGGPTNPHFGNRWNDEGFSPALQDPWEKSGNQVGHFLTAVNLGFDPSFVSKSQPAIVGIFQGMAGAGAGGGLPSYTQGLPESIRDVFGVPKSVSDQDLAIMIIVGHEKVGDMEKTNPLAFFNQFHAATKEDVDIFLKAEKALGTTDKLNLAAAFNVLKGIKVGNQLGNSTQDLLLSVIGWRFGQQVAKDKNDKTGQLHTREQISTWLRKNLK